MINLNVIYKDEYGLREFTKNTINILDNRCRYCYYSRLDEVARYAKENGYDAFCTSLLISPYQKHDLIKEVGESLEKKYGIKIYNYDFSGFFLCNFTARQKKAEINMEIMIGIWYFYLKIA